jgi:uncharacterized protein with PhoU and TrkA domain
MSRTLPSNDVAAQVARLEVDIDALDRGVLDAGLTASRALARAEALERMISVALSAAGLGETDAGQASFADPVVARLEARRRRLAEAHRRFTVIPGGAS